MNTGAPFASEATGETVVSRYKMIFRYGEFLDNLKTGRVSVTEERNLYRDIRRNVNLSLEKSKYPRGGVFRGCLTVWKSLRWL